jgi:hypothetical protein
MKKLFFFTIVLCSGLIASEKEPKNLKVPQRKTVRGVVKETIVTTVSVLPFVTICDTVRRSRWDGPKKSMKTVFPQAAGSVMRESPLYFLLCLTFYATKHMPKDF